MVSPTGVKHLITLDDLRNEDIYDIFDMTKAFKEVLVRDIKKVPTLRGKTIALMFFEPSTRTRISFELAAKRLSADVVNFSASTSSLKKSESLKDTLITLESMKTDIFVVRHFSPGVPLFISKIIKGSILNAGDGAHSHPTQALLDLFSIYEKKNRIKGLKIVIVGDTLYSRVVRSDIIGMKRLGAEVIIVSPPPLLPREIEKYYVRVEFDLEKAIRGADVVMALRLQLERQKKGLFPSQREYNQFFGLKLEHLKLTKKDVLIMHPGPMNRGVEITSELADSGVSIISEQVTNGVAVRMALLYFLSGGKHEIIN
jgi:aspartate carbamoyltransferase catalytic subunit